MILYAFRITWNLLNGTVCLTPFYWIAKIVVKADKFNWFTCLFCVGEGCDGYSARIKEANCYPAPNEIIKIVRCKYCHKLGHTFTHCRDEDRKS